MNRIVFVLIVISFTLVLSGCNMIGTEEALNQKYCDEHPTDSGCITDSEPTGVTQDDNGNTSGIAVHFTVGNQTDNFTSYVNDEGYITEPTAPVKEGYTFIGWYEDEAYTTPFDFTQEVDRSITIYAKFELFNATPFDRSNPIEIYMNTTYPELRTILFRLIAHPEAIDNDDYLAPGIIYENGDTIVDIMEGSGNGISYTYLSKLNGSGNVLRINGVEPSLETIISNDYGYVIHKQFLVRNLWFLGDDWYISDNEPDAQNAIEAFSAYLYTNESYQIITQYGGMAYPVSNTWDDVKYWHPKCTSENGFDPTTTMKIGVAPEVESIVRALVEGFSQICNNVGYNIEVMDTHEIYRRVSGDLSAGDLSGYLHIGFGNREFDIYDTEPIWGASLNGVLYDAIVFTVNADNPVTNITSEDLYSILFGVYETWDDVQ